MTLVSFLHGKSVSRMKSFFRAVKCFFWVSHLHLKWTFVARACEGLQGSTRGANGSRIKNILGKEKWFHEETFYKLRMELCSMITGIVCFQWRKQWRKSLKQWNQFSNPWKKTGKTWSNSSQNWTKHNITWKSLKKSRFATKKNVWIFAPKIFLNMQHTHTY